MKKRFPIFRFFIRFMLVFILLILPQLFFFDVYSRVMRNVSKMLFSDFRETGEVLLQQENNSRYDTKIIVYNKAIRMPGGYKKGIAHEISLYLYSYLPFVLICGLFFATPMKRRQKIISFIYAFICLYLFSLIKIYISILNTAFMFPELEFVVSDTKKKLLIFIHQNFIENPWPTYMVCVFLWLFFYSRTLEKDKVKLLLSGYMSGK